ncbi:hypothetical protein GRF61_03820 [Azoarcus sp. TTM-91]|uniref:SH3 domain-containing protein n=1 Tax=Azoarcus sp. TTM-91 TaxID=2691581 RepID=UPI00145D3A37|nr:SH3 domain-containing protein [Azoarcus sp. TTM-91]NMG33574.1 hypothetical protein [Azoarcus sp. TTM-91]
MIASRLRLSLGLGLALACASPLAQAIEFRSVAAPAILYDSPSNQGKRLFIVAPGTPVEVVVALDKWVKVRDPAGAINWIERGALSDKRTLMVTAPRTLVRQHASEEAPPAFEAVRDLVLELVEAPANGWVKVRHQDGASGYIRVGEVWGL